MIYELIAFTHEGEEYKSPYLYSAKVAINLIINLRNKKKGCRYYLKRYSDHVPIRSMGWA
jgi:hypothetical protein